MPARFNLPALLRRRPVSAALAALMLALVVLATCARYWIATDAGRDFVLSQVDGRDVAGYGRLSLRQLDGDPLSSLSAGSVEIRDASGVWLSAESIELTWSPMALLSRRIDLAELSVSDIRILRRPVRTGPPDRGGNPWEVRLGQASVDRLFLARGVAGPESASSLSARFVNARNGSVDAQLQITPLDRGGDRIDARILRGRGSGFSATIDATAPAGGVFAHLLQLPEGASALVTATAAGDLGTGRGEARLAINASDKVFLSGKLEDGVLDASLRLDAGALPLPDKLTAFLGPRAEAGLTAVFEGSRVSFTLDSRIAAGTVNLSGQTRTDRLELTGPARLTARLTSLAPYWDAPRLVTLDGALEQRDAGFAYTGDVRLDVKPEAGLAFERVSGQVTASFEDGRIPFSGEVRLAGPFAGNTGIAPILGDEVHISGNGNFDTGTRRLLVDAAEFTHASGRVQLLGEAGFAEETLNISGRITQSVPALPGGFSGNAAGFVQVKGKFRDFDLGLNLDVPDLGTRISEVRALAEGRAAARGLLAIQSGSGVIRRLDFRLPGAEGQVTGRLYGPQGPDLEVTARQLETLDIAGSRIDLGKVIAGIARRPGGVLVTARSQGGAAVFGGQSLPGLASSAAILFGEAGFSGPVTLTGRPFGQASEVSFILDRARSTTRFSAIDGRFGKIGFSGLARLQDGGEIEADIEAEADTVEIAGVTFGTVKLKGVGRRAEGDRFALGGEFEARRIRLSPRLEIDEVIAALTTTPAGYRFEGRLADTMAGAGSDIGFSGVIALADGPLSGTLSMSGQLLGIPLATRDGMQWSLGPAPALDADLSLLGGQISARLRPGADAARSTLELSGLSVAPLLRAAGYPAIDAVISGGASGRMYGEDPEGIFNLSAVSSVSGVAAEIDFDMTGSFDRRALTFTARSTYGPDLKANAAGRLPVLTSPSGLVRFDREGTAEALLEINADLRALRLIALAYGHDIGGRLASRTRLGGTLRQPVFASSSSVTGGAYEYGATGLRLRDIDLEAVYEQGVLTLEGAGAGTAGGALTFNGRLAQAGSGIDVNLDRILIYDHLGDQARLSGNAKLVEGARDRVVSGALTVNGARFNIGNFADTSIRTLNVRWTSDDPVIARPALLNKPIRLDLKVSAPRGIIVRGRGLDIDWGIDLDVTGNPDRLLLNGRATLARGTLELAQRPFEFGAGQITFDGPIDTARLSVSAAREVEGFSVRADVGGSPSEPTVDLSSTPSLPEDEILSRMLFGRSSVDLTALEAAELATSIARLAGQDTGFNPIGALQAGLGLDRLRVGVDNAGNPELGVGQYLAPDVYLEVATKGASGNSVEVEWQPRPQVSVSSETSSTGDSRVSVRWKKDY